MGFPGSSAGKESVCNAGDPDSIPGLGRSPGEGIGYPLQYSWASLVAQLVKNPPAMKETWVQSLGWKYPLSLLEVLCGLIQEHSDVSLREATLFMFSHKIINIYRLIQIIYINRKASSLPAEPQGKPKNTGVGSLSLLQWVFLTQELNQGLFHCRQILYRWTFFFFNLTVACRILVPQPRMELVLPAVESQTLDH